MDGCIHPCSPPPLQNVQPPHICALAPTSPSCPSSVHFLHFGLSFKAPLGKDQHPITVGRLIWRLRPADGSSNITGQVKWWYHWVYTFPLQSYFTILLLLAPRMHPISHLSTPHLLPVLKLHHLTQAPDKLVPTWTCSKFDKYKQCM